MGGADGASAASQDWPSFRGPAHTGVAPDASPPLSWSESENVRFKVELEGTGHASPIVADDRIYVLSAVQGRQQPRPDSEATGPAPHRFTVAAYDFDSGKRLWSTVVREEVPHESLHTTASQASASPVADGKHVYAFFGSRGLHCLDRKGKIVWSVDLGTQSTRNEFGEGASPTVLGETVFVNWDHEGDSFLVAIDKTNGKERWRKSRDEPTSWSTPVAVRDGERDLVVVSAANRVRAYDPLSGEVVWSAGGLGLNVVPTPVATERTLWAMSGWREAHGMAIRYPGAKGELTGGDRIVWEADQGLSYVPSPVLVAGKIYFFQRFGGILSCYDLDSGEACYDRQRIENFENIYASPVAAGNRIYAVSRDGSAVVLEAGPEFSVLARNTLDDSFSATPAVVGKSLVLRGEKHLYRIAEP